MNSINEQAENDFKELFAKFKNSKSANLKELCEELGGHNFEDNDYFDLNYGVMCVTFRFIDNEIILETDGIELWESTENSADLVNSDYSISEKTLKEMGIK